MPPRKGAFWNLNRAQDRQNRRQEQRLLEFCEGLQEMQRQRMQFNEKWARRNEELTRERRVQEIVDRANRVTRARVQRAALKERHERVEARILERAAQRTVDRREGHVLQTIGGILVVGVLLFLGGMVLHIFLGWMGVY